MTHATGKASRVIDLDAPPRPAGPTSSDRLRTYLLAGATVLGPLLMMAGLALEVDEGDESDSGAVMLGKIAEDGAGQFYASNLLAALGLVLMGAAGLTVMRLVRARGGALATAGGVLALISGAASATGMFMYGAVVAVMSSDDLDREAMGSLQDELSDAPQLMPAFSGFIGLMLAFLLLAAALVRARVAPTWVAPAIVLSAVAFFFVNSGGMAQALALLPLLLAYAELARRLVRADAA